MITDNIIIDLRSKQQITSRFYDKEIVNYILNRYSDSSNFVENLYRILNGIDEIPICKECGNKVKFNFGKRKYNEFCSIRCSSLNKQVKEKREKTNIKKYGVKYSWNNDKQQQTCLEKYGSKNVFASKQIKEKIKQTCLTKFNVEYFSQSQDFKNKVKTTFNLKSKNEKEKIQNKIKQTCIERYGCENPMQNVEIRNKTKETCLCRFGVDSILKLKNIIELAHTEEANEKRFKTQKNNGSLNASKEELYIFEKLKTKFDIEYHYKDKERYPFICDFYIPSLDLFIEYQGSMFHNKRPYLGTANDLQEIEEIKQKSEKRKQITGKNKSRYDSLIETWTIRDVKKREIAKQNNLNYLEFFNLKEFNEWYEKI